MTDKIYKKALILAGGRGRRMGGCNKAALPYDEETFLDKILLALEDFEDISISLNREQSPPGRGLTPVYDTYDDIGPLSGIYEGLKLAQSEDISKIFLSPCDCPNLTKDLISYICEFDAHEYDAVIVRDRTGGIHPLLGIYKTRILPLVEEAILNKEYKVRRIYQKLKVKYVPLEYTNFDDMKVLKNINTPKDYEELLRERVKPVIAISGIKNSGKTTLIEHLLGRFRELGLNVGTLKHDGHDFQMDTLGSDTYRHFLAGARSTMIFSNSKFMFMEERPEPRLSQLLPFFEGNDLLILEGFKGSDLPKVEVIRREVSATPASNEKNLIFYATDVEEILSDPSMDSVSLEDKDEIFYRICTYFKEKKCLTL